MEFILAFFSEEGDVQVIAINDEDVVNKSNASEVNLVAETGTNYKTKRTSKKDEKLKSASDEEESPYNPEFVKMVLEAAKGPTTRVIDPSDIWGSLGLK